MRALDRKLLRDLWQIKGQALAIVAVMACGVAMFVMMLTVLESLEQSRATYYDRSRFAQVFGHLKRAPLSLAERIEEIPGVAVVQTRIVVEVTLDVKGLTEPATGRIISVPDRAAPELNDVYLRTGRLVEAGRAGEVLVSEVFAEAHGMKPGDTLSAVINGKRQRLTVVGVALSPEYVFQIRPGDLFPDNKRFAVMWMAYTDLASAFNMRGAFNDISLSLTPTASEPEVLRRLDALTEPYGGLGAYGRVDQTSHAFLDGRMKQLRGMGLIIPTVFLSVTAFLLNVVLGRQIAMQREQIAALKAFGYTSWQVGWHYLKLVLLLVVLGVVFGTLIGAWMARGITALYAQFYHFPVFGFHMPPSVVVLAALVCLVASGVGALAAVRRAMKLPPAEALRPEPPATYRPTVLERLGLRRLFSQPVRMVLRNLERRPMRALMSSLAIALAVSVLIVGSFSKDALEYLMAFQFGLAQRQDMMLTFVEPTSSGALNEVRNMPGVVHCESFRSVPVRLRSGHLSRRLAIMGLPREGLPEQARGRLYRLLDDKERPVSLPAEGLVLSDKLAELLHVKVGDVLRVEVLEGQRPVREAVVAGLVHEFTGTSAYMDLAALNRFMREGSTVSGAFLSVDPVEGDVLYQKLKVTPRVAGVTIKEAALRSLRETMAENLLKMRFFNILFASVIAFGVVYNTARISLQERGRELATLRVIGFTRAEISFILLGELAVLTLAAVPVGLAVGYGLAALATRGMDTDLYRIPLVVDRSTFAFAATVVLTATLLSGLVVRRQLDRLDLVSVLKTKE
jgi:putative ABC transport system permease protein